MFDLRTRLQLRTGVEQISSSLMVSIGGMLDLSALNYHIPIGSMGLEYLPRFYHS